MEWGHFGRAGSDSRVKIGEIALEAVFFGAQRWFCQYILERNMLAERWSLLLVYERWEVERTLGQPRRNGKLSPVGRGQSFGAKKRNVFAFCFEHWTRKDRAMDVSVPNTRATVGPSRADFRAQTGHCDGSTGLQILLSLRCSYQVLVTTTDRDTRVNFACCGHILGDYFCKISAILRRARRIVIKSLRNVAVTWDQNRMSDSGSC
jgi:hypothetical protein